MTKICSRFTVKNEDTGEEIRMLLKSNEEITVMDKTRYFTEGQKNFLCKNNQLHEFTHNLGGFIQMCYVKNELLFNKLKIGKANISRLIYLATYIDYNNRKENLLVRYSENNKVVALTRDEIRSLLKLSERTFINFLNEMRSNNLIFTYDDKFYISPDYFTKGKNKLEGDYTRIFINTTKFLFENCNSRQHKQLSYVYQLIPYMNHELNVICNNPNESDFAKLDKLGLKNICEVLGVSLDKKSMYRFENDLLKFKIEVGNRIYYIFKRVIVKGGNGKYDYFVINPKIVWSGNNVELIKDTVSSLFFK